MYHIQFTLKEMFIDSKTILRITYPDTSLIISWERKKNIQLTLKLPQGLRILHERKKTYSLIKKGTVTKGLILDQNASRVRCFSIPAESSNWKIMAYTKK